MALEQELAAYEQQVQGAIRDYQGVILARAAERCVQAGAAQRAKEYFGRAIDSYLEFGYYDVAATVCRRVIGLYPDVVRARCTLAFLSLGSGLPFLPFKDLLEDARRELGEYVRAAQRAGMAAAAAERLFMMADVTDDPEIRTMIVGYLQVLGAKARAGQVMAVGKARHDIDSYVRAAQSAGRTEAAIEQLVAVAGAANNPGIRRVIAEYLLELGATEMAAQLLGPDGTDSDPDGRTTAADQRERWIRALRVAIVSREDIKREESVASV